MTEKLYYQDPYIRSFEATIKKEDIDTEGKRYVVLDQTAFYPTGGGQPYDTGTINGVAVVDVEEIEGEVRHYIEESLQSDVEVEGEINWNRRFDHMQQHAGQHILSAAFEDLFGYQTVSFHLGQEVCTIDLDVTSLSEEEVKKAENAANNIVLHNNEIQSSWVSSEEASRYPLRKQLSVSDNIRLVIIPEVDYSGCGGTHPVSTGEVGGISVMKWEKQKKQIRVTFVCGKRMIDQLYTKQKVMETLTNTLNVPQESVGEAALRLVQQTKDQEKTIEEMKEKLLTYKAKELLASATTVGSTPVVQLISHEYTMKELQKLAKIILSEEDAVVVLLVSENEEKIQVVCGRGADLELDMNAVLKTVLPLINGKGGGKKDFAQGGGEAIRSAEDVMRKLIKETSEGL